MKRLTFVLLLGLSGCKLFTGPQELNCTTRYLTAWKWVTVTDSTTGQSIQVFAEVPLDSVRICKHSEVSF